MKILMFIMRLFVFFIVFGCGFSYANNTYSQTTMLTINVRNKTVAEVFSEIEKNSEYVFFFYDEVLDKDRVVSINVKNQKIDVILDKLFENTHNEYLISDRQITIARKTESVPVAAPSSAVEVQQQGITITGSVMDAEGQPLPGVTIIIKGTSRGTASDSDGRFTITVPDRNAVLTFSYIGFTAHEQAVGNQTNLAITLREDATQIDEIVVIGYGSVKKRDLTGSVASVGADDIILRGTTSVMGAIQGAVPGVDITQSGSRMGNSFNIQIRGQNTLNNDARAPLYVVDGVFTDNIDFLNPMEIERVDILKDASSTAIYGSRGSNGVVLVTTKTADFGAKSRTTVSYDGFLGIKQPAHMPEFTDGRGFIDHRWMCYYTWTEDPEIGWSSGRWTSGNSPTMPILAKRLYERDFFDWLDACLQTGKEQNHYVNISGNTRDISYNLGVGYSHVDGSFIKEVYDRYNFNLSVNHKPSKYFQSGATVKLSFSDFDGGSTSSYSSIMGFAPIFHAYHEDGSYVRQPAGVDEIGANYTSAANPLLHLESETEQTRLYKLISNFYLQVSPIDGLDIRTTFSPSFTRNRKGYFNSGIEGLVDNSGSSDNRENFDYIWQNQISYTNTFSKHHVNATIFNDVYRTRYERLYVDARLFPYDSYWYNLFSGTVNLGNCRAEYQETSLLSFGSRVFYEYDGKYLATATIRYDGSSKLANKWGYLPSFALAWRLSEEDFMQASWITNLKPRFTLGYSGNNSGVGPFGSLQKPVTVATNTDPLAQYDYNGVAVSGFAPGSPVNESLGWEKTRELNFGLDFGFLKNRINGNIEFYDKLSDGLLMQRSLALESGVASMTDNIGSVNNRGVELMLNTVNVDRKDFYWSTTVTFTKNKNAIRTLLGKKEDMVSDRRFIGQPINVLYDYKILGIWTQAEYEAGLTAYYRPDGTLFHRARPGEVKTQDTNNDGILNGDDRVILGGPDPTWTGSFSSNLQFKNWDFSFVIYSRQGVMYDDQFTRTFGWPSGRGQNKVKYDYYTPPNVNIPDYDNWAFDDNGQPILQVKNSGAGHENSKYPIYQNASGGYYGNNHSYKDGSFVKIKTIVLGYTFNQALIKKAGMSHLRLYANVTNPFIFTKYVGWDPEYGSLTMANGNGPSSVVYQVGLNVKF